MTEYYRFVRISPNPALQEIGDSYLDSKIVNWITHEAGTGTTPGKGAGYRGKFGGVGFDGMWTDVSVIFRPATDGVGGREYISTTVDIGSRPPSLVFDADGLPEGGPPRAFSLPVPLIFDSLPQSIETPVVWRSLAQAATAVNTLVIAPLQAIPKMGPAGNHIVPRVLPAEVSGLQRLPFVPRLVELDEWESGAFNRLVQILPDTLLRLRLPFGADLLDLYRHGVRVFHLAADYHGRSPDGVYILDAIRQAHDKLVEAGVRDQVTLIGSGGLVAAEHLPKAILCGLDLVALDTPVVVALQGRPIGEVVDPATSRFVLPHQITEAWGTQRLMNLCAAWRDQLLQIIGPMGICDVRRLRGETGRAMFMKELEAVAFEGIDGYPSAE